MMAVRNDDYPYDFDGEAGVVIQDFDAGQGGDFTLEIPPDCTSLRQAMELMKSKSLELDEGITLALWSVNNNYAIAYAGDLFINKEHEHLLDEDLNEIWNGL